MNNKEKIIFVGDTDNREEAFDVASNLNRKYGNAHVERNETNVKRKAYIVYISEGTKKNILEDLIDDIILDGFFDAVIEERDRN